MTRSRAAAIVIALPIAAGAGAAAWWVYAHHQMPILAERLATLTQPPASQPSPASRVPAPPVEAIAPQQETTPSPAARADASRPSFDIVRVEPRGDTVVAGKGAPNAKVTLMSGGKVLGEAKADGSGQFVILPPPLAPGSYDLTLRQKAADGLPAAESAQSVAVSVPKPGKGSVVVALAEPGKATKLLSGPPEAPAAASPGSAPPAPSGKVAIRSAELENGSGFFVSGSAKPGEHVHVYLNDAHIAEVVASRDGDWSVRVKKGLTGGHYVVRADAGGSGGKVVSRAQVPFDVPKEMAAASAAPHEEVASATPTPSGAGATASDATLDSVATALVSSGDNLWNISRYRLGDGKRYTQIYAANVDQIRNPNLIYPGQVFVVPAR